MGDVIQFPNRAALPPIDFDEVKELIKKHYPKFYARHKKMVGAMCEASFQMDHFDFEKPAVDPYPPEVLKIHHHKWSFVWLVDILSRFGGSLEIDGVFYEVKVKKPLLPLLLVNEVSKQTYESFSNFFPEVGSVSFRRVKKKLKPFVMQAEMEVAGLSMIQYSEFETDRYWILFADKLTGLLVHKRLAYGEPVADVFCLDE